MRLSNSSLICLEAYCFSSKSDCFTVTGTMCVDLDRKVIQTDISPEQLSALRDFITRISNFQVELVDTFRLG